MAAPESRLLPQATAAASLRDSFEIHALLCKGASADVWSCSRRGGAGAEGKGEGKGGRGPVTGAREAGEPQRFACKVVDKRRLGTAAPSCSRSAAGAAPESCSGAHTSPGTDTDTGTGSSTGSDCGAGSGLTPALERLQSEVAIHCSLSGQHPGILELWEVLETPDSVNLVTPLCPGGDLFSLLEARGRMPEGAARGLLGQVASALAFCHREGVLHRDVKPENMLFDCRPEETEALYADCAPTVPSLPFASESSRGSALHSTSTSHGSSSSRSSSNSIGSGSRSSSNSVGTSSIGRSWRTESSASSIMRDQAGSHLSRATQEGQSPVPVRLADFGLSVRLSGGRTAVGRVGSKFYCAPEVVKGSEYGLKADVWSLGVVLYLMLTGRLPFFGGSLEEVYSSILAGRADYGESTWADVSQPAEDLVRGMLVVDPKHRLSAAEVAAHPWVTGVTQSQAEPGSFSHSGVSSLKPLLLRQLSFASSATDSSLNSPTHDAAFSRASSLDLEGACCASASASNQQAPGGPASDGEPKAPRETTRRNGSGGFLSRLRDALTWVQYRQPLVFRTSFSTTSRS